MSLYHMYRKTQQKQWPNSRLKSQECGHTFSIRLNISALLVTPRGVLTKRKFFRSITNGLALRSACLKSQACRPQDTVQDTATGQVYSEQPCQWRILEQPFVTGLPSWQ